MNTVETIPGSDKKALVLSEHPNPPHPALEEQCRNTITSKAPGSQPATELCWPSATQKLHSSKPQISIDECAATALPIPSSRRGLTSKSEAGVSRLRCLERRSRELQSLKGGVELVASEFSFVSTVCGIYERRSKYI